jgi:hypothetical protein
MVFDSMATDTMQLRATLLSLVATFGASVLQAVVVVASKKDRCLGKAGDMRLEALRRVMAQHSVTELVTWQSESLDEVEQLGQLSSLRAALQQVHAVVPADLQDLWKRQKVLAQELCDHQPLRTQEVLVEELQTTPYEEQEAYQFQEPYQAMEERVVQVNQERHVRWAPHESFCRMFTHGQSDFGHKETVIDIVDQTVQVEVTKYREVTRYRPVTKYQEKLCTVTRTEEYRIPVEGFYTQALEQIIGEIRTTFMMTHVQPEVGVMTDVQPEDSVSQVGAYLPEPDQLPRQQICESYTIASRSSISSEQSGANTF